MKKILLVDDHAMVRECLKRILLDVFPSVSLDEATCGQEGINKVWKNDYDTVLLDISMPGRDGLNTLIQMKIIRPDVPILVLSVLPEELYGPRVLKAGAQGYLEKTHSPEELVNAIKKILKGEKYMSRSLSEKIMQNFEDGIEDSQHEKLSDSEFQVLRSIASGKKVKNIADEMALSHKTIFKIQTHIKKTLKMKSNAEIVRYAIKQGFIE